MDFSLSTPEFKALSSESRTTILKLLEERNHTLSELSAKTKMAAPTIKEHMKILSRAGLVEIIDEGRKWKYYTLTKKGRNILGARIKETNVLILLSTTLIAGLIGLGLLFATFNGPVLNSSNEDGAYKAPEMASSDTLRATIEESAGVTAAQKTQARCRPVDADQNLQAAEKCAGAQTKEECESVDAYNQQNKTSEPDSKADCTWPSE